MSDLHDDPFARLHRAAARHDAPELDPAVVSGAPDRRGPRLVRRGRAVRAGGVSLAAVAMVAAGALVVTNPFAGPGPLFTAAGSGGAEAAALSADSRMMMWVDYDYLAGEGLSTAGGHGTVYQLRRTGEPETALRTVAAALGLAGEPRASQYSSPDYPSYVVGPEDGSAPFLSLSWAGTGDWWYNDPAAFPQAVCAVPFEGEVPDAAKAAEEDGLRLVAPEELEALPEDPGISVPDCTQPALPEVSRAPGEDEARSLAAELFRATGLDVGPGDIRVVADEWQTLATANLEVAGTATALEWSVAWSPLGGIAWAAGHAVEAVARGDYGTVSAADAVDRLDDWRWSGAGGPDYASGAVMFAADAMARDAAAATENPDAPVSGDDGSAVGAAEPTPGGTGDDGGSSTPGDPGQVDPVSPGEPPSEEPVPVDPEPEPELPAPETVTVTLEHAEATLLLMWDSEGNAWLVPGYAYELPEQGGWTTTVGLVEGVIRLPEPVDVEPVPAEPLPAEQW